MSVQAPMERPQRWDVSYGPDMSTEHVDEIMAMAPFSLMDESRFPSQTPLRDILLNDTRIVQYQPGEVIYKQGDYGNSAFFVIDGDVRSILPPGIDEETLGRRKGKSKSLVKTFTQFLDLSPFPESRRLADYEKARNPLFQQQEYAGTTHLLIQDFPAVVSQHNTATIQPGTFFGEIAALNRSPRPTTVMAHQHGARLLEIRWQGLRELLRSDTSLKEAIDQRYRTEALIPFLRTLNEFSDLSDDALKHIAEATDFVTYGDYDWSGQYKRFLSQAELDKVKEPTILKEGDYANGVAIVRAGFARISEAFGKRRKTLKYMGAGQIYGMDEIRHNANDPQSTTPYIHTMTAVGYAHILLIPSTIIEQYVLNKAVNKSKPEATSSLVHELEGSSLTMSPAQARKAKAAKSKPDKSISTEEATPVPSDLLEFFAELRFLNGTRTMIINLDHCTRCDDCVRACAATHGNNPRFVRHGPTHNRFMVANACMHCQDPVCMLGCPTGAIHRSEQGGQVVINDLTCIGCASCANNCPYDSIRMVEIRDKKGNAVRAPDGQPINKATKCDLCIEQPGGPSCQRACPHDALRRVNMSDLEQISDWL